MTETPQTLALDWHGLTNRIRAWQAIRFPGVTEEVGKWRTLNELAELGKKIASHAPEAEIYEEAADCIITMQHCQPALEYRVGSTAVKLQQRLSLAIAALLQDFIEDAFYRIAAIFPDEATAYAEVERKFAKIQKRKWKIAADGTGQHMSAAEKTLAKVREWAERETGHNGDEDRAWAASRVLALLNGKEG